MKSMTPFIVRRAVAILAFGGLALWACEGVARQGGVETASAFRAFLVALLVAAAAPDTLP